MAGSAAGGFVTRAFELMLKECANKKYTALQSAIHSYLDSGKDFNRQSNIGETKESLSEASNKSSSEPDVGSEKTEMGTDPSIRAQSAIEEAEPVGRLTSSSGSIMLALSNAGHTLWGAEAELVLNPLMRAFETKNIKVVELALDCLHKLIEYNHLEGDPGLDASKEAQLLTVILSTVCSSVDNSSPDSTTLQVLKVLLTAVASTKMRGLKSTVASSEDVPNPMVEEVSSSDHNEPTVTLGETLSMKEINSTSLASVKEMQSLAGGTNIKGLAVLEKAVNLEDGGKVTREDNDEVTTKTLILSLGLLQVLKGMCNMNAQIFRSHLRDFYPLIRKLVCCDQVNSYSDINEIRHAASRRQGRGSDPPARTDPELGSDVELIAKPKKSGAAEIKLPETYELLDKFFNNLDCSIRLLQLKRSKATFTNVRSQIETLTDRRFTYSHLAQLKFIMPEAIVLEKVLQLDERTSCMKPDLCITMNIEAIESKGKLRSHSGNLQLRKVFRSRLLDFFKSHPQGDEVPEEVLPEPFNRLKENASSYSNHPSVTSVMMGEKQDAAFPGLPVTGSHLPPSFKRSFSRRGSSHQTEILKHDLSVVSAKSSVNSGDKLSGSSGKETGEMAFVTLLETPVKCINSTKDEDQCFDGITSVLKTPVNMVSTPGKLMIATPTLQPPKRCCMSTDDNSFRSPSKLVRRPPPNRSLKFDTPVKNVKVDDEYSSGNSSIHDDILTDALLQSIQEKGRLASVEQEPAISQTRWRQQMIASLPKLFDTIHLFYRSIRRSVVTKKELIQKLISQLDVIDTREVEEQLRLLQELAPEWIYEKSTLSGDLLLCVNKISSPEVIRTRLSEAK